MQYRGLMRRRARYYLRVKVPVDLVATLGRRQIWKALGTSDRREAICLYFPTGAQLQATFQQARRLHLSPDEVRRMVAEWLAILDRETAGQDLSPGLGPGDPHLRGADR